MRNYDAFSCPRRGSAGGSNGVEQASRSQQRIYPWMILPLPERKSLRAELLYEQVNVRITQESTFTKSTLDLSLRLLGCQARGES
jgi:hypothetical protein